MRTSMDDADALAGLRLLVAGGDLAVEVLVRQQAGRHRREGDDASPAALGQALQLGLETATEELHNLRISAKRLRYTLELFRAVFGESGERQIERVKAIQEELGNLHDADVRIALQLHDPGASIHELAPDRGLSAVEVDVRHGYQARARRARLGRAARARR